MKRCCYLILCLILACSREPVTNIGPVIRMEPIDAFKLSEYFDQLEYVFLNAGEGGSFSEIDQVAFHRDRYFFLDQTLKSVYCYDTTGAFLFRIHRYGQGPGEYLGLNSIWVNSGHQELFLHCRIPDKTLAFSLNGVFLREYQGNRGAHDRVGLADMRLLSYTLYPFGTPGDSVPSGVFLSDSTGQFQKQLIAMGMNTPYWQVGYRRHFTRVGPSIHLLSQSDTLYRIDPKGDIEVDMILDWGTFHLPEEIRRVPWEKLTGSGWSVGEYFHWKDMLIVTGPLRWFHCGMQNEYYYAIANLTTGEGKYAQGLVNDLGVLPVPFPISRIDPKTLVGVLNLDLIWALHENLKSSKPPEDQMATYKEVQNFIDRAIRHDQPVLVRMHLLDRYADSVRGYE